MRRALLLSLLALPLYAQTAALRIPFTKPPQLEPQYVAVTADGAIWAASRLWPGLDRVERDGSDRRVQFPYSTVISDLTVGPDGALWLATNNFVVRHDPLTDANTTWGTVPSAAFIRAGSDGNLWVVQRVDAISRIFSPRLVRMRPDGVIVDKQSFVHGDPLGAAFVGDALWLSLFNSATGPMLLRLSADGKSNLLLYVTDKAGPLYAGPRWFWGGTSGNIVRRDIDGKVIATYPVAMTPVGSDAEGNLILRARTALGEEIGELTPAGLLVRYGPLAPLPSNQCHRPVYGGFTTGLNGEYVFTDYYPDLPLTGVSPCRGVAKPGQNVVTILDPLVAPVISTEHVIPGAKRRSARH